MKALIMAGGKGSRMGYKNKAMLDLFGKPMIWYTLYALRNANIDSIICAVNNKETAIYLAKEGVNILNTEGKGYSLDLKYALDIIRDITLIMPVDLPLVNTRLINYIIDKSRSYNSGCLCIMVKKILLDAFGIENRFSILYNDEEICYTGISIIDGSKSDYIEEYLIIDDYRIALNINSEHELRLLKTLFKDYLIDLQSEHRS